MFNYPQTQRGLIRQLFVCRRQYEKSLKDTTQDFIKKAESFQRGIDRCDEQISEARKKIKSGNNVYIPYQ